jgi:hypothetical protein
MVQGEGLRIIDSGFMVRGLRVGVRGYDLGFEANSFRFQMLDFEVRILGSRV